MADDIDPSRYNVSFEQELKRLREAQRAIAELIDHLESALEKDSMEGLTGSRTSRYLGEEVAILRIRLRWIEKHHLGEAKE